MSNHNKLFDVRKKRQLRISEYTFKTQGWRNRHWWWEIFPHIDWWTWQTISLKLYRHLIHFQFHFPWKCHVKTTRILGIHIFDFGIWRNMFLYNVFLHIPQCSYNIEKHLVRDVKEHVPHVFLHVPSILRNTIGTRNMKEHIFHCSLTCNALIHFHLYTTVNILVNNLLKIHIIYYFLIWMIGIFQYLYYNFIQNNEIIHYKA